MNRLNGQGPRLILFADKAISPSPMKAFLTELTSVGYLVVARCESKPRPTVQSVRVRSTTHGDLDLTTSSKGSGITTVDNKRNWLKAVAIKDADLPNGHNYRKMLWNVAKRKFRKANKKGSEPEIMSGKQHWYR